MVGSLTTRCRAKQAGGERAGRPFLTDTITGTASEGRVHSCFSSWEDLPACCGRAGLGHHSRAWQVAGNGVMLVTYITLGVH